MTIKLPLENLPNTINIRGLSLDRKNKKLIFNSSIGSFKYGRIIRLLTRKVELDGNIHCSCCGKVLKNNEIFYNRIYPREVGGIKIPQNMLITCSKCNKNKGNMTKFEYLEYINSNEKQKKVIKQKVKKSMEFYRKERAYKIPKTWIEYININTTELKTKLLKINNKKMLYEKEFYEKYEYFITPIIINTQNYILNGVEKYKIAQKEKLDNIPVIIIENIKII